MGGRSIGFCENFVGKDQYNYMEKINRFYGDSYMNFT